MTILLIDEKKLRGKIRFELLDECQTLTPEEIHNHCAIDCGKFVYCDTRSEHCNIIKKFEGGE